MVRFAPAFNVTDAFAAKVPGPWAITPDPTPLVAMVIGSKSVFAAVPFSVSVLLPAKVKPSDVVVFVEAVKRPVNVVGVFTVI
jgi:hypothetical protein